MDIKRSFKRFKKNYIRESEVLDNEDFVDVDLEGTTEDTTGKVYTIEVASVITDENRESWFSFTKDLHNGMSLWISDSKKVIENLKTIKEVAGELKAGDIISEEDFKSLIKIAPEVAENFIKTAEGYKLLTSGNDLNKKLKDQYKNLDDIEKKYAEIKSAAGNFGSGSTSFNQDAFEKTPIFSAHI